MFRLSLRHEKSASGVLTVDTFSNSVRSHGGSCLADATATYIIAQLVFISTAGPYKYGWAGWWWAKCSDPDGPSLGSAGEIPSFVRGVTLASANDMLLPYRLRLLIWLRPESAGPLLAMTSSLSAPAMLETAPAIFRDTLHCYSRLAGLIPPGAAFAQGDHKLRCRMVMLISQPIVAAPVDDAPGWPCIRDAAVDPT